MVEKNKYAELNGKITEINGKDANGQTKKLKCLILGPMYTCISCARQLVDIDGKEYLVPDEYLEYTDKYEAYFIKAGLKFMTYCLEDVECDACKSKKGAKP